MVYVGEESRISVSPEMENVMTSFHNILDRKDEQLRSLEQYRKRLEGEKTAADETKARIRNWYNGEFQGQGAYIERLSERLQSSNRELQNLKEIHNNILAEIR